jgi:HEAT repeat protein
VAQQPDKKPPPDKKPQPPPEAVRPVNEIGGRKLEQWIADISSKDRSKGENALRTVLMFGPEKAYRAVPAIVAELKKHSPFQPIDTSIRVNAAITLGTILGQAEVVDPRVVDEAVAVLKGLLSDQQALVKYRVAEALGRIGPRAKAAVPYLIGATADRDTWEVRHAAVLALGTVAQVEKGKPDPLVTRALCDALRDDSFLVRLGAAQALLWLGPPATASRDDAVAALRTAAKDPEQTVQITAHLALLRLKGGDDETHLKAIGKFLENADPLLRMQGAEALGTVGPEAKSQVPRLIAALKDRDARVVSWSVWALTEMGPAAREAVPQLKQLAGDMGRPENLRKLAAEAVQTLAGKDKGKAKEKGS